MFAVAVSINVKSGMERDFENSFMEIMSKVKEEEGTLDYVLHRSLEDKNCYYFYEKYSGKEAFDSHLAQPYLQEIISRFDQLIDGEPQFKTFEPIVSID